MAESKRQINERMQAKGHWDRYVEIRTALTSQCPPSRNACRFSSLIG
ncbi:unnamed protein product [uncultured bacterium]|nr:unnamed protein product [uncultured bacterium]